MIEPECPLLPVRDARRHVHDLIDGGILLEKAAGGQPVMKRQEADHGESGREIPAKGRGPVVFDRRDRGRRYRRHIGSDRGDMRPRRQLASRFLACRRPAGFA